jgi:hypothetical protein
LSIIWLLPAVALEDLQLVAVAVLEVIELQQELPAGELVPNHH